MSRESVARRAVASRTASAGLNMDTECVPPPPSQEFQTARLFLSHFQLLDDWPVSGQDKQQVTVGERGISVVVVAWFMDGVYRVIRDMQQLVSLV